MHPRIRDRQFCDAALAPIANILGRAIKDTRGGRSSVVDDQIGGARRSEGSTKAAVIGRVALRERGPVGGCRG